MNLAKHFPWRLANFRLECWLVLCNVVFVHVLPWEIQELVLVLPADRICLELFGFGWRRRWFRDLGDEVGGGSLCKTVYEYSHQGNLNEDIETQTKPKKYTGAVLEPKLLLFSVIVDTREVGLQLGSRLVDTRKRVLAERMPRTSSRMRVRDEK